MRNVVRNASIFAAGIVVGSFLMQPGEAQEKAAQRNASSGLRLNHVGIYAKDYDESMRFYTQTIGLKEAFTIKDAAGKPTLSYLQITKDTFLEIAPATAERPVGLSHVWCVWREDFFSGWTCQPAGGSTIASTSRAGRSAFGCVVAVCAAA